MAAEGLPVGDQERRVCFAYYRYVFVYFAVVPFAFRKALRQAEESVCQPDTRPYLCNEWLGPVDFFEFFGAEAKVRGADEAVDLGGPARADNGGRDRRQPEDPGNRHFRR